MGSEQGRGGSAGLMIHFEPTNEHREGEMGQALRIDTPASDWPCLSLDLPGNTTFEEWVAVGRRLRFGSQAVNWQIGDWWAFGDHHYGERAKAAAKGVFGLEFQTLANLASVARAFEPSRRRELLSFTHHAEVAGLANKEPEAAESLLDRAAEEEWPVSQLRREVVASKTANDHGIGIVGREPPLQKAQPQSLSQRELIAAYEIVVEFAEAIQEYRALTRREQDHLTVALTYLDEANADRRPVPDDFEIIFVEQGRIACEDWYRASRITVNRWLITKGKRRLIERRADFVKFGRSAGQQTKPEPVTAAPDDPMFKVAQKAAEFLRVNRYGGWVISSASSGGWLVGTVRKTSDELIAMAERQGFEPQSLSVELARG